MGPRQTREGQRRLAELSDSPVLDGRGARAGGWARCPPPQEMGGRCYCCWLCPGLWGPTLCLRTLGGGSLQILKGVTRGRARLPVLTVGKKGPSRVSVPQLSLPLGELRVCFLCSLQYPSHCHQLQLTLLHVWGSLGTTGNLYEEEVDHSFSSPEEGG